VLPFVRGLLGLEGDAREKRITFAPHFPGNWDSVTMSNYRIGNAVFSLIYKRAMNRVIVDMNSENASGFSFELAPVLPAGSIVRSFTSTPSRKMNAVVQSKQMTQPKGVFPIDANRMRFEIEFDPNVEILPFSVETKVGHPNHGLKIVAMDVEGKKIQVDVEGLSNRTYALPALNLEKVERIQGASIVGTEVVVTLPDGKAGDFVRHTFIISTK